MTARAVLGLLSGFPLTCALAADQAVTTFALSDPLNRNRKHELVNAGA